MASYDETETTVSGIQADKTYLIGSNRVSHISRLDKEVAQGRATLVSVQGDWYTYSVSESDFHPLTGFKTRRKPMSEAQRLAAVERLAKARNN